METCERYIWVHGEDRRCHQAIGLIRWHDNRGHPHQACHNHVGVMTSIYPIADPPGPVWLGPDLTTYESWTDAGWTEAELREAFGG